MPLKTIFRISSGSQKFIDSVLVKIESKGLEGWGEAPSFTYPIYHYETAKTIMHIIKDYLSEMIIGKEVDIHKTVLEMESIRGHNFAKAAVEEALWDLTAKFFGLPLYKMLGGCRKDVPINAAIGIQESVDDLLRKVADDLDRHYAQIKIKVKKGLDVSVISKVRKEFGDIPLMVDANGNYSLADLHHLRKFDQYDLNMIEQPLSYEDILDHATLQQKIDTPICLDESIRSPEDARKAIMIGACRIINIKPPRVGGLLATRTIHDIAKASGIPVWCGGHIESGVGQAHKIAAATLPNFIYPNDIEPSDRYLVEDIVDPPVTLSKNGTVKVLEKPGIGYEVNLRLMQKYLVDTTKISL
jgi:O-succinylbenzoate synthase